MNLFFPSLPPQQPPYRAHWIKTRTSKYPFSPVLIIPYKKEATAPKSRRAAPNTLYSLKIGTPADGCLAVGVRVGEAMVVPLVGLGVPEEAVVRELDT